MQKQAKLSCYYIEKKTIGLIYEAIFITKKDYTFWYKKMVLI